MDGSKFNVLRLGLVICTCNPSYMGGIGRRALSTELYWKKTKTKRASGRVLAYQVPGPGFKS
jgi:hypothetical protein